MRECVGVAAAFALASWPADAWALPSPFALLFFADLVAQFALVALVLVPMLGAQTRIRVLATLRRKWWRFAIAGALMVVTSAVVTIITPAVPRIPVEQRTFEERLAQCQPADAETAAAAGVEEGAYLIDVRPPMAFNAYHILESCNLSLDELFNAPEVHRQIHDTGAPVYPLTDRPFTNEPLYEMGYVPMPWMDVRSHDGGVKSVYMPNDRSMGWGPRQEVVVDITGDPVSIQLGPMWFMGQYTAPASGVPNWHEVSPGTVPWAVARGAVLLDVREIDSGHPGAFFINPADSRLDAILRHTGPFDEAVFLCDYPAECLNAESIAAEMLERGMHPLGYVRIANTVRMPSRWLGDVETVPRTALLTLLFVALGACGVRLAFRALSRQRESIVGPFAAVAVGFAAWPVVYYTPMPAESVTWLTYMSDVRELGVVWLPAVILPPLLIGLIWQVEHTQGRGSWRARIGICLAVLATVGLNAGRLDGIRMHLLGITALAVAALAPVVMDAIALAFARRRAETSTSPSVHALSAVEFVASAGPKSRRLAEALAAGIPVPRSAVLLAQPGDAAGLNTSLSRALVRRLGPGPYVVRSTAEQEDQAGALQAGRFLSVTDVGAPDLLSAAKRVLEDYVAKGADPQRRAAVLIQPQRSGDWAGVALREPAARGGGLLVEAAPGVNFGVTDGTGDVATAHAGLRSRGWTYGALEGWKSPSSLMGVAEHAEALLGARPDIEWTATGGRVTLLQMRPAPAGAEAVGPYVDILEQVQGLKWLRGRGDRVVLSAEELAEFSDASQVTTDLLTELWARTDTRRAAFKLLGLPSAPQPANPPLLRVYGQLFENRVIAKPLHQLWNGTWGRTVWALSRYRPRRRLRQVAERLQTPPELVSPPAEQTVATAAVHALACRAALLRALEPALAIATIGQLVPKLSRASANDGKEFDPLMRDLAAGVVGEALAANHPHRAIPDLAIELPRLGDDRAPTVDVLPAPPPLDASWSTLRSAARVHASFAAAQLRAALLALGEAAGRDDVFDWIVEDFEGAASGTLPSDRTPPEAPPVALPSVFTLDGLEAAASAGAPVADGAGQTVSWVGTPRQLRGTVTLVPDAAAEGVIVVLPNASPAAVAAVPRDAVMLVPVGSGLCHGALIARERNMTALFGCSDCRNLSEGDQVVVETDGSVTVVAPA